MRRSDETPLQDDATKTIKLRRSSSIGIRCARMKSHTSALKFSLPARHLLALTFGLVLSSIAADPLPTLDLTVAFPELKFNRPLWMEEAPDGTKRLFVVEQGGKVFTFPRERNAQDPKLFLDITDRKPQVQNEE